MTDRLIAANITLGNYAHNLSVIAEQVGPNVQTMAIVKANAYGHGAVEIAKTAIYAGVAYVGVVSVGELKQLRKAGIKAPILVLNYIDNDSMAEAIENNASVTIFDMESVNHLQIAAKVQGKIVKVHLKIDTGMHRAGCGPNEVLVVAKHIEESPNLELEGVMTHLAESEDPKSSFTEQQLEVFRNCLDELRHAGINPPLVHAANSAAIFAHSSSHFTMVRPGLVSYGINPFPEDHPHYEFVNKHMRPVMSLCTQVVFIRKLAIGESVGYNRRWKAERESVVGLLPVGYGDGYRRGPKNAQFVLIHGKKAPIVGSISMDQTTIDVTDMENVKVGDEAVLIGEQAATRITAQDIASAYGTISYEVVTSLAARITRKYS